MSIVRSGLATNELFQLASIRVIKPRLGLFGMSVRPENLANRVWKLLLRPQRRVVYIPRLTAIASWMQTHAEWLAAWLGDRLFPIRIAK